MDYFKDKVALITGSARGIGFATARLMGKRGAKVFLTDLLEQRLAESTRALKDEGIEAASIKSDVTSPEDCGTAVKAAIENFGKLDVLINNAGVSIVAPFDTHSYDTARKLIEVNVIGVVNMTIAALPEIKRSRGHLIFVSSVSGIRAVPTGAMYSSSKAFLRSMAESLRLELKPAGVHVGVISPGFTTTDPEKTVMLGDGSPRPINRPPHDTPEGTARAILKLIERRERERVTTPFGKLTHAVQRLSPSLVDLILSRMKLKD